MHAIRALAYVALVAVAWAVPAGVAFAGKPGGGGGGSVDTGVVCFRYSGRTWSMNPDGSGKAGLPEGVVGEPSHALHGGHRWFVVAQQGAVNAIRDDAAVLAQLTAAADVASPESVRWSPDDARISWVGQAGVYVAVVVYDANGDVSGVRSQPTSPSAAFSGAETHDWAPDGARLVVGDTAGALWIANVSTGGAARLPTSTAAGYAVWSPDGGRIAYQVRAYGGGIRTVAPDGSGDKAIVTTHAGPANFVGQPLWSPRGTHLVYQKGGSILDDDRWDVYRTTASGSGQTNLTSDLDTRAMSGSQANPVAWR